MVGPAFEKRAQVMELLQVATNKQRCAAVMDSRDEDKTKCRFPEEAKEIRAYIKSSVGYVKLDRQVLSGIASGCMDRVLSVIEQDKEQQNQAADMVYGLAEMLFEAQVRACTCLCVQGWGGGGGGGGVFGSLHVRACVCVCLCAAVCVCVRPDR